MLAVMDEPTRERILSEIHQTRPELAAELRKRMVSFSQFIALDPISLQKVLRTVPPTLLAKALRGLKPELEAQFFSKVSERQGQGIKEERDSMGPQKSSDVEVARGKILEFAQELHRVGEIKLF